MAQGHGLPNAPVGGADRRRQPRRKLPDDGNHFVEFAHPNPGGATVRARLNDVSPGGMSFILEGDFHGLEVCAPIKRVLVRFGDREIRGDLVVIHITHRAGLTVCGVLVYPRTDDDLRVLQDVVAETPAE